VIDSFPVHVLEANAIEQSANRGLFVIGPERSLSVPFGLQEGPTKVVPPRRRIAIENAKTLFSESIANEALAIALRAGKVVAEDERVLAFVTVGIDDVLVL
jgi:hypothetical protein